MKLGLHCAVLALVSLCAFAQAAPPNDECSSPTPITGEGQWNLDDLLTATQSVSPPPIPGTVKDVWFCWTPSFAGMAQIDVGAAQLSAEVYLGCGCPGVGSSPIATAFPGAPTRTFPVECGQRYLVRIGAELYPFPQVNPVRNFSITKLKGTDCLLPTGQACNDCCGGKPSFDDPIWTANYTGQVAVVTNSFVGRFGTGGQVLSIINFASTPAPVPGLNWDPVPGAPTTSFRYSQPNWDQLTLGSIFPVAIDGTGNIYTAYCAATNEPLPSSLANSTGGSIFKIATGSGAPSVFVNIPDNAAPLVGNCGATLPIGCPAMPSTCPPGIGDVSVDCAHGGQLFASAFADGRIYRISSAGALLEAYDHATDSVQPAAREVGNNYDAYVPRGERVWAVKAHQGRLYYSVWGQEMGCDPAAVLPNSQPNTIWSIALNAGGGFVAGTRRLELQVHTYPVAHQYQTSSPVASIAFSPDCRMLLSERMVAENGVLMGAHACRALEYAWTGTAWIETLHRNGYGLPVGGTPVGLPNTNACGGGTYDFSTGPLPAGRMWLTGDTLFPNPNTYGITGLDPAAPLYSTAIHIDYSGLYTGVGDKAKLCDVEIPCDVGPCAEFVNPEILCNYPQQTGYTFNFQIKNTTGQTIRYFLFPNTPGVTVVPNVIKLDPPLPNLATSPVFSVNVQFTAGTTPPPCIKMILVNEELNECCKLEYCPTELPNCYCGQMLDFHVECVPNQPGKYLITFKVQNLGASPVNSLFLLREPPFNPNQSIVPNFFSFPAINPGGISPVLQAVISGLTPGQPFCFKYLFTLCDNCCAERKCFIPPVCPPGGVMGLPCAPGETCYANCDGSTVAPVLNVNDFICFQTKFAEQDPCANCDGSTVPPVLNVNDFICFVNKFGNGCP